MHDREEEIHEYVKTTAKELAAQNEVHLNSIKVLNDLHESKGPIGVILRGVRNIGVRKQAKIDRKELV